jgi:hypothetical protein
MQDTKISFDDQAKEDEMAGPCSSDGKVECI